MFSDVENFADFIRESRRNAVTVRGIYYKVLDKLGLLDEKKKAQLKAVGLREKPVLN